MKDKKSFLSKIIYFFKKYFIKYTIYEKDNEPFALSYENTSDVKQRGVMFGSNLYSVLSQNYGMSNDVVVKNTKMESDKGYLFLLNQSGHKPFRIETLRLQAKNLAMSTIKINKVNGDGQSFTRTILPMMYLDAYQFQNDVIDMSNIAVDIDASTHLSFNIKPKSRLFFTIFISYPKKVSYFEKRRFEKNTLREFKFGRGTSIYVKPQNSGNKIITYFKRILLSLINKPLNK